MWVLGQVAKGWCSLAILPCPFGTSLTLPGPFERSGTTTHSGSHQTVFSCFLPSDFMFVISDWDTRIEGKEFLQKEDVSKDLESKA